MDNYIIILIRMNNYIMSHALSDINSLRVHIMADMICHKVYELLMSILINVNEPYSIIAKPA